jgi:hypothetical protein
VPPNKHMLRAVTHKVLGRGRSGLAPCSAPRARVLMRRRAGADVGRYAAGKAQSYLKSQFSTFAQVAQQTSSWHLRKLYPWWQPRLAISRTIYGGALRSQLATFCLSNGDPLRTIPVAFVARPHIRNGRHFCTTTTTHSQL